MAPPSISVILPVCNSEATIAEAVDSILGQTCAAFELIIVDDGSSDDTQHIVERYASRDERVRLVAQKHAGIIAALQRGCALALGQFIARMDADDIAEPTRLERQRSFMESAPHLALCGAQVTMFGETVGEGRRRYELWLNRLTTPDAVMRERFIECPVAHPAFFFRREWYDRVGGYQDQGWPEDYDLVLRTIEARGEVTNVSEPLIRWRERPDRHSMTHPRYSLKQFRACKRHYLKRSVLNNDAPFYQWGAGEVGKAWLREWDEAAPVVAVDIHPRKIGKRIHRVPIIPPDQLPRAGECVILVAVGAPGARSNIREWLEPRGYQEGRDFWFIA